MRNAEPLRTSPLGLPAVPALASLARHGSARRWPVLPGAILCAALLLAGCATATDAPVQEGTPRLVLLLVADQVRGDYLDRFAPLFEGGLRRLQEQGQVFTDAEQDHASTATSPGYANISTGTYPSTHGIVGNGWFDRRLGTDVYSVEDPEHERSPNFLLAPTLGDRLRDHWPSAKVYSIGGKDRATILMAGRRPDGAYWYDSGTGTFTSSTFYIPDLGEEDALPTWLREFNEASWTHQFFGTTWTPIHPDSELRRFDVTPLDRGAFSRSFSYPFGRPALQPGSSFYSSIYSSPWMDRYTVELAKTIIDRAELGRDEIPDLLAVNLTSTDAVGHTFGPDSPELVDNLVRLDRALGDLLDHVDTSIGLDNVVVVLSSDHGVGPVPEVAQARGEDAARLAVETTVCVQQAGQEISERFGLVGTRWMPGNFYFDREVLAQHGVALDEIRAALATDLSRCPRVERVMVPEDLADGADDPVELLFQRSYHPDRSPDLLVHLTSNTLMTTTTASHGTAHRYDRWVPLIFLIPEFPPQRIAETASVVDIVPTVAALVGLLGVEADGLNRLAQLEGARPLGRVRPR